MSPIRAGRQNRLKCLWGRPCRRGRRCGNKENLTMRIQSNRKSVYFFIALGACLVALAVALNVGWVVFHWRQVAMLVFGVIFFVLIIAGLVLNTIFLVREIRRNEQHNSFINAVTHELKTPI